MLDAELGGDEAAKAALAANLPYYGDDPAKLWWLMFAVAQGGFIRSGGTFIKGGSSRLSTKLARIIEKAGGDIVLGRIATAVELDAAGRVAAVRHADTDGAAADRVETRTVLANCAPQVLETMLPAEAAARFAEPYRGLELSTSLFTIRYGVKKSSGALPQYYSTMLLPDWMTRYADYAQAGELLAADPGPRLPPVAVVNYAAIDAGLDKGKTALVTLTGVDRLANWVALSKQQARARRSAWTDAFTERLEREWPGFAAAVTQTDFMNARSLHDYLGTPDGAVYGFAMTPPTGPIWEGIPRSPRTAVEGLFLASSFAGSGGFSGAIGTGEMAATLAGHWLGTTNATKAETGPGAWRPSRSPIAP